MTLLTGILIAVGSALLTAFSAILIVRRRSPVLELRPFPVSDPRLRLNLMAGLTGGTVFEQNTVEVFQDQAIFDAILDDIGAASAHVHVESYVWSDGELADRFATALSEKARAGISVRVLIDAIGGNKASDERLQAMRDNGVAVEIFHPLRLAAFKNINHRTHRKLVVVDGEVAYSLGHGISDDWYLDGDIPAYRDTGVRIRGLAAHALQSVFLENWIETTAKPPLEQGLFPAIASTGDAAVHVVKSSDGDQYSDVALLYSLALVMSEKEVLIQNPYFVPDKSFLRLIEQTVRRGVRVRLMIPGQRTDSRIINWASHHILDRLLNSGAEVYQYSPTLLHQKIMVMDGRWSQVGSTNLDARSLEVNEEVSVGVESTAVAEALIDAFNNDLRHCRKVTAETIGRRPIYQRFCGSVAYFCRKQL